MCYKCQKNKEIYVFMSLLRHENSVKVSFSASWEQETLSILQIDKAEEGTIEIWERWLYQGW